MIVVTRFRAGAVPDDGAFESDARAMLASLSVQSGFVRGRLGRAVDQPTTWAIVTEWDTVGSYRRGLSAYDVKVATAPLLEWAVPEPSAYEVVASADDTRPSPTPPSMRAR